MSEEKSPFPLTFGCKHGKISLYDALLRAKKWNQEEHPLILQIFGPELYVSFHAIVGKIDEHTIHLQPMAASQLLGDANIGLDDCSLHYCHTKEVFPESFMKDIYDATLTIIRPDGSYVFLTEYRILDENDIADLRNARNTSLPHIRTEFDEKEFDA
jgi:hypothetical protein